MYNKHGESYIESAIQYYRTTLLVRCSLRLDGFVLQQPGNGEHPGWAHGSALLLVPKFIWLSPHTMLVSNFCFNCIKFTHQYSDSNILLSTLPLWPTIPPTLSLSPTFKWSSFIPRPIPSLISISCNNQVCIKKWAWGQGCLWIAYAKCVYVYLPGLFHP